MNDPTETAQTTDEGYPSLWTNRTFLRFFVGRFVSNAGDSLYRVAILWLVFELSGSTVLTGVANSLLLLPFLLQIIAGPLVDRFPIKPLLVGSQIVQGVVVLVLPVAAYTGNLSVALILVMIPALSLMALVVAPSQAALVPRTVADHQLSQANSALTTISEGMDMIFDALGGLFIAIFGATALFLVDSLTFAVAGLLFVGMMSPAMNGGGEGSEEVALGAYVADLRAGINVLRGTVFVDMMFTEAVFNFALGVTLALLPAFGDRLGGAAIYGLMLGALGIGRVVGSASASYLRPLAYGRFKAVTYLLSALLWVGSVYVPSVGLTVGLFGLAWIAAGIDAVRVETLTQNVFPHELLGRVSAIKNTVSTGTLPIGSLVGGVIAEQLGIMTTMGLAAFGFGFGGLYFALRPSLREIPAMTTVTPADVNLRDPSETDD